MPKYKSQTEKNQIFKIQEATIHIQWENLDEMDVLNK